MSWHFSRALEAEFSAGSCSAGEPFARSSAMTMRGACSCPDKTTDALSPSLSGTTCEPLTESCGLAGWISSRAASHARTSARPEAEPGSTGRAPDCGERWRESFAKWDRASSSWKTPQCSLFAGLDEFSGTWPRWGMMRSGACSERSMPAHLTNGNGFGFWPTIRATDGQRGGRGDLIQAIRGNPNAHYRLWPPPRASANENRQTKPTPSQLAGKHGLSLCAAVNTPKLWPTPTVCGNYNRKGSSANSGDGLATAVKLRPTPTCQDAKNNGAPSQMVRNTKPLNAEIGGALNPTWVEWLMGWPLGWTDCAASGMAKFLPWLRLHLQFSAGGSGSPPTDKMPTSI